jgi:hypothetical protein
VLGLVGALTVWSNSIAIAISIEGVEAASSPGSSELRWGAIITFAPDPQLVRDVEEGAQHGGAIVVHQFDEARFLDETTELDEMACPRAPVLHPLPRIGASTIAIEAVLQHGQALELTVGGLEVTEEGCRLGLSSRACPHSERRSDPVRPTSRPRRGWICCRRR